MASDFESDPDNTICAFSVLRLLYTCPLFRFFLIFVNRVSCKVGMVAIHRCNQHFANLARLFDVFLRMLIENILDGHV